MDELVYCQWKLQLPHQSVWVGGRTGELGFNVYSRTTFVVSDFYFIFFFFYERPHSNIIVVIRVTRG